MIEWLAPRDPAGEATVAAAYARGTTLTHIVAVLSEQAEQEEDEVMVYARLYAFARSLYHGIPCERTATLARALYDLEEGMGAFPDIVPGLSPAEMTRRLALLDVGRLRFKQRLVEAFAALRSFSERNFIIGWARIAYYHVHGFQAPPTPDARQAMRDAAGESDHFLDLMEEVIDASPDAVQE